MDLFLKRVGKFFFIPLLLAILAIIGYFAGDPFRFLYSYDTYSGAQANRDYVSVEMFKKQYPYKGYNSFMFGSSRLLAFHTTSWDTHLSEDAVTYKLEGFSENIYGIYSKVKYLDENNIPIKNALVLLDVDLTFSDDKPQRGHLFRKHPDTTDRDWLGFHIDNFRAYFDANVVLRYALFKLGGVDNDFVRSYYAENTSEVDTIGNNLTLPHLDDEIESNPVFFEGATFYDRPDTATVMPVQITESIKGKLEYIAEVFKKDNTDYKLIIGPIYSQKIYNSLDLNILNGIFGEDNVYDFSGKNRFTEDKHNHYENYHYRLSVGDSIMNYIYKHHN